MFSDNDIDIIKDIVIATVPGVDSIFQFSSQARGTARETSDIDIATRAATSQQGSGLRFKLF